MPLFCARLDTRSAPSMESRQAQANGAATWSFGTTCETRLAAGAWSSSTSASRMNVVGVAATTCKLLKGHLTHPQDIDAPLHIAAQRKINSYRQPHADNQNISFLPEIVTTSTRMHGEFLRLLFLQDHRETKAHFTARRASCGRGVTPH